MIKNFKISSFLFLILIPAPWAFPQMHSHLGASSGIAVFQDLVIYDDRDMDFNTPPLSMTHRGIPVLVGANLNWTNGDLLNEIGLDFSSVSSSAANSSTAFRNARWTRFSLSALTGYNFLGNPREGAFIKFGLKLDRQIFSSISSKHDLDSLGLKVVTGINWQPFAVSLSSFRNVRTRVKYQYANNQIAINEAAVDQNDYNLDFNFSLDQSNLVSISYLRSLTRYQLPRMKSYEAAGLSLASRQGQSQDLKLVQQIFSIGFQRVF